jgi:hypothetical protein
MQIGGEETESGRFGIETGNFALSEFYADMIVRKEFADYRCARTGRGNKQRFALANFPRNYQIRTFAPTGLSILNPLKIRTIPYNIYKIIRVMVCFKDPPSFPIHFFFNDQTSIMRVMPFRQQDTILAKFSPFLADYPLDLFINETITSNEIGFFTLSPIAVEFYATLFYCTDIDYELDEC